jgi:hypothetical protein
MLTTDREIQLQAFRGQNAFPALLAAHDDGFFDEPIAFLGNQRARLLWRDAARQIKPFGVHRQDGFADEVVNTELDKAGRVADFIELGELMCVDALNRNESCGGHFREESQTEDGEAKRDDQDFAYVAAWENKGDNGWELHKENLNFEIVKPTQRSYK